MAILQAACQENSWGIYWPLEDVKCWFESGCSTRNLLLLVVHIFFKSPKLSYNCRRDTVSKKPLWSCFQHLILIVDELFLVHCSQEGSLNLPGDVPLLYAVHTKLTAVLLQKESFPGMASMGHWNNTPIATCWDSFEVWRAHTKRTTNMSWPPSMNTERSAKTPMSIKGLSESQQRQEENFISCCWYLEIQIFPLSPCHVWLEFIYVMGDSRKKPWV